MGEKYKEIQAEIKALEDQEKAMVNIHEDRVQLEAQHQNITQETAKGERIAEKKKINAQKRIQAGLKKTMQYTKEMGRLVADSAAKIKGGLQNAFVIGTAAASAFFYKMQPLAEEVQEFEKTLINANSVFNVSKKELFEVSDTIPFNYFCVFRFYFHISLKLFQIRLIVFQILFTFVCAY